MFSSVVDRVISGFALLESLNLAVWAPAVMVGLAALLLTLLYLVVRRRRRRPRGMAAPVPIAEEAHHGSSEKATTDGPEIGAALGGGSMAMPDPAIPVPPSVGPVGPLAVEALAAPLASAVGGPNGGGRSRVQMAGTLVAMGREAAFEGNREVAYRLVRQALEMDSRNVEAWIWRAATAEATRESVVCLKTALLLDPGNPKAQRGLAALQDRLAEEKGEQ